ncbi:hypothetical protein NQ318_003407 [Aromia moschata]|uniref:Uncharacterized protein n=1 Tax=Aromia moschata TaxID=1265417 RepID=A0AAV8YUU9_9CUCU|nr:hypothetical protein NQ318_003407 [Aromia moschata]
METRMHCCSLGTNYSSNGLDCKTFQPPIVGVDPSDEKVCLSVLDVCCKKRYREIQCELGKEDIQNGGSCPLQDGDRKDCCEACQAGIDSGTANEACQGGLGLDSESICDSDVCAQLCEPVGNSYKCDCFQGYVLMEDGSSCRPKKRILKKGGRCDTNNPCDHDCTDTGTAIKCSCREGYELSDDKTTCKDIDECEFGLMHPTKDAIRNTIGSFTCEGEDTPKCPPGFHYKAATQTCVDIDEECITGQNDCNKESQRCLNTKGNYTCVDKAARTRVRRVSRRTRLRNFVKVKTIQKHKIHSYRSYIFFVLDINECVEEPDSCKENEECVNEPGGHTCIPLRLANHQEPPQRQRLHNQQLLRRLRRRRLQQLRYQSRVPMDTSFRHKSTPASISTSASKIGKLAIVDRDCVNTIGSFLCNCKTGFTKDPSLTGACVDINASAR